MLALGGAFVRERVDAELRRAAEDALRKLARVLPPKRREAVARWQRELLFPTYGGADPTRLGRIRSAIQDRGVVHLLYHAFRRPGPEPRAVEPISLVYLRDAWLLAAYCRLRQAPRFFRLDRIDRLELSSERFTLSERHAVRLPDEEWKARATEARVRFDPAVERWVRERQPYIFLREELDPTGPIFVYALRDEPEVMRWLLAWGAAVEVLSPPELRARLAQEARAILTRHADAPDLGNFSAVVLAPDTTLSGALE